VQRGRTAYTDRRTRGCTTDGRASRGSERCPGGQASRVAERLAGGITGSLACRRRTECRRSG